MILEKLQIPEYSNKSFNTTGIDSSDFCLDEDKFSNYPFPISYNYNSRGYRDREWPSDSELSKCIWCIGDSFTVGVGSPFEHTWPQVLQANTGMRTINISMDGSSNEWMKRKIIDIIHEVNPKNIVVMWSYTHRRESNDSEKTDFQRRIYHHSYANDVQDFVNFRNCINYVNEIKKDIIHFTVPNAFGDIDESHYRFEHIKSFLGIVEVLDYGRDNHHFDHKTSDYISKLIIPLLST